MPDTPKRSSTTDETMIVSIVMPETGLRAMVAIALAATEVKKKEKTSVSSEPDEQRTAALPAASRRRPRRRASQTTTPTSMRHDRDVAVGALAGVRPRRAGRRATAIANEPATMRSDFRMPKIPAVAIAPTPMKRT